MLKFLKVTSENLKIGKLPLPLKLLIFRSYLWINLNQIQVRLKKKSFFEGIYDKKTRGVKYS